MRFSRDGLGCINKGLTADEAGEKAQALELYKRGWQHLLRAISVSSQGEECVSSSWGSARQMQHKMQRTLNNITTCLAILETSSDLGSPPAYSPQAVDGHLSISYGTGAGKMSLVGKEFYIRTSRHEKQSGMSAQTGANPNN
uniref:spartin-like n=1 Tax=Epinephelus lanceolatus TaxID=310571 RepID=UPI001445D0E3|nr:spartin-like [Epinephelus lanceolatus]